MIFKCSGGQVALPDPRLVLIDRRDGGNLIVNPPREVWERSVLSPDELTFWSFLVAATGRAMIDALPQLEGGCVNYWEAGNWALNVEAEPKGPKTASSHRRVHAHLLGRSRSSSDPSARWGEAPKFPDFAGRFEWAAKNERLTPEECRDIVGHLKRALMARYGFTAERIIPSASCPRCAYPLPAGHTHDTC